MDLAAGIGHPKRSARIATLLVIAVAICASSAARAEQLSDIPAAFVDVGIGTREMGMAGAAVAGSRGATAVFWNPAGLAAGDADTELAVTYGNQMGLVPYSAAAGVRRVGERWALGAGIIYSGDEVLSEMTGLLCAAGEFGSVPWMPEGVLLAGASLRTRWASFGGNDSPGEQVTGSVIGAALDVGAVVPLTDRARLGVSGRDLVGVLNWDSSSSGSYEEGVPPALVVGVAVQTTESSVIEVDLDKALRQDCRDLVAVGGEVSLFGMAALRAGYRKALAPHDFEEFTVGAGASMPTGASAVTLDVAYVFGKLEDTLRLGVGFAF